MNKLTWTISIAGILASVSGFASEDVGALITCSSATETRTLSIAPKDGGCELMYEKNGKLDVAASSELGTSHCEKSRAKIRDRLKAAGWKCGE